MNTKTKKGFALALLMIFIIIFVSASFGLSMLIQHIVIETKLQEAEQIRGYYAGVAGLRYAAILLRNPTTYFNNPEHNDETYTITGLELGGDFFADINTDSLTATITEWSDEVTDPEWHNWEYFVEAVYRY